MPVGLYYVHFDTNFENLSDYNTVYSILVRECKNNTKMLGGE